MLDEWKVLEYVDFAHFCLFLWSLPWSCLWKIVVVSCELVRLAGVVVTYHLDKCLEDSLAGILQNPDSSNCSFSSSISCFTTPPSSTELHIRFDLQTLGHDGFS